MELIVIGSYPPRGEKHHKSIVGGASYTKNTLQALQKEITRKEAPYHITVLAEQLDGKHTTYEEDGMTVTRLWKRNSLLAFPLLVKQILGQKNAKHILIEFEFALFGNTFSLLPFPFFLLLMQIFGKHVSIVYHQVITDFNDVSGHIDAQENGFRIRILNSIQKLFLTLTLSFATNIIVFEESLKKRLHTINHKAAIAVIPHGVETIPVSLSQKQAREHLKIPKDKFVVVSFGFLAWYKGTDWLVDQYLAMQQHIKENMYLIIAGGANPNRQHFPFYQTYLADIEKKCHEHGIRLTGFVPQEEIAAYYQAADLIVLPYRAFISASGPLSLAFSFEKPFLLSKPLEEILKTKDLQQSLEKHNMSARDLVFSLENTDFEQRVEQLSQSKEKLSHLANIAKDMKEQRSWDTLAEEYYREIFG